MFFTKEPNCQKTINLKRYLKKNSFKRVDYFQVEHARWFSKCAFVRQNKGQGFIDQVLQRAAELVS